MHSSQQILVSRFVVSLFYSIIMTEDTAYTVVSFVIARSATFLKAAEKRLLIAAQVSYQHWAIRCAALTVLEMVV